MNARAALPQNCSLKKVHSVQLAENGTYVLDDTHRGAKARFRPIKARNRAKHLPAPAQIATAPIVKEPQQANL